MRNQNDKKHVMSKKQAIKCIEKIEKSLDSIPRKLIYDFYEAKGYFALGYKSIYACFIRRQLA